MKLANRFPESVKQYWIGTYTCLECGQNHADCLHHCLSPSSMDYIKGEHNQSILNSCPLNNENCHLHKPMHTVKKQKELLNKVKDILDRQHYKYNETDKDFLKVYSKYYD